MYAHDPESRQSGAEHVVILLSMTFSKVVTTVATAAVALTSLAACSAIDERNEQSTVASTETVMSTETVTREQTSAPAPAAGGANTK